MVLSTLVFWKKSKAEYDGSWRRRVSNFRVESRVRIIEVLPQHLQQERLKELDKTLERVANDAVKILEDELAARESYFMQELNSKDDQWTQRFSNEQRNSLAKHEVEMKIAIREKEKEIISTAKELNGVINANLNIANREKQELNDTHNAAMWQQRAHYQSELSSLGQKLADQQVQHHREVEDLVKEFTEEMDNLKSNGKRLEQNLMLKHEKEISNIQRQMGQLSDALLANDDKEYQGEIFVTSTPPKTDQQLRKQFLELQALVEELSRSKWKQGQQIWTEQTLERARNEQNWRSLRKVILQDSIWTLLYVHVFASPFRIFGEEGGRLETEWAEKCGRDLSTEDRVYTWPERGAKTERWRYITVKECRDALREPLPSEWDPRARLKKGYVDNQSNLVKSLETILGGVVELDEKSMADIRQLSKKAAIVSLEFGMQRCRIVVRLSGSPAVSASERVDEISRGPAILTVLPTVGRYGNARGAELDTFTVIRDCNGESLDIP